MGGNLSAWLAANRTEAIGVGAAAVAGLALYSRKRKAAGGSGVTAGAVAPGTIPAGSVVPAAVADSSSFDAYNALQDEIGTLARNSDAARNTGAGGSGVGAAVGSPLASSMYAPSMSGQYAQFSDGSVGEVETDGSVYHLSLPELGAIQRQAGGSVNLTPVATALPADYSYTSNLAAKIKAGSQLSGA